MLSFSLYIHLSLDLSNECALNRSIVSIVLIFKLHTITIDFSLFHSNSLCLLSSQFIAIIQLHSHLILFTVHLRNCKNCKNFNFLFLWNSSQRSDNCTNLTILDGGLNTVQLENRWKIFWKSIEIGFRLYFWLLSQFNRKKTFS